MIEFECDRSGSLLSHTAALARWARRPPLFRNRFNGLESDSKDVKKETVETVERIYEAFYPPG